MKAAPLTTRPDFPLITQSDIVSFFHLQMPRWLFSHSKYRSLSLEAKVAYTFLLNRFQLSRRGGWLNEAGEVFVVFPRESLAEEMQISYRKAIECFKELAAADLIWGRRLGRGNANQIYLALVRLEEKDAGAHNSAPFGGEKPKPAKPASLRDIPVGEELPGPQVKGCGFDSFGPAVSESQDLPEPHPSKTEQRKIERGENEVSPMNWRPSWKTVKWTYFPWRWRECSATPWNGSTIPEALPWAGLPFPRRRYAPTCGSWTVRFCRRPWKNCAPTGSGR